MDYLAWNDALGREFFRSDNAGRRVYLYVTTERIQDVGADPNSVDDFVNAVVEGPPWVTRKNLCQRAIEASEDWRQLRTEFPPYLGYLGLFALAATIDGPFPAHAYYPRLNTLLGRDPKEGPPPSFPRMLELWSDLEQWSVSDTDGRFGLFVADIAGEWIHVGIPLAQTILTDHEREGLPAFFAAAAFDPNTPPADFELYQALCSNPPETLRSRTRSLLADGFDANEACRALVGVVGEELEAWDSTLPATVEDEGFRQTALRLCCSLDRVTAKASFTLRCSGTDDLPTGVLELKDTGSGRPFECESAAMGWSSPVVDAITGAALDAASIDWAAGISLVCGLPPLRLRMPPLKVRILASGAGAGLPGFVEQRHLVPHTHVYIVARADATSVVETWGKSECENFRPIRITRGLPADWQFYEADSVRADSLIRKEFPNVSLPTGLRLSLIGGVRTTPRSSQYFDFAPPRVHVITNAVEQAVVPVCHDMPCIRTSIDAQYLLPTNLPRSVPLRVTVCSPDGGRVQRFLQLAQDCGPIPEPVPVWRDRFGCPGSNALLNHGQYAGAVIQGARGAIETFFLPGLRDCGAAILIGREPGQIARWPGDSYPVTWQPVWIVHLRRKGRASFCGNAIELAEPSTQPAGPRKQVAAWKDIVWHRRRRISAPDAGQLRGLWQRYQDVARAL